MKTAKELFKDVILDDGDIEVYQLPNHVTNWPNTPKPDNWDNNDDWDEEPQDLENWEIISIEEDKIRISCGGDWQQPLTLTLVRNFADKFKAIDIKEGFELGIPYDDIIEKLSE